MSALRDGWWWAVGTLTVLPTGRFDTSPAAARVMIMVAPFAVLPLALLAGAATLAGRVLGAPDLIVGLLVVGLLVAGTRAMHVDGLADVADGFGGGWTPERARELLKRGDIGPMALVALVVSLGLQVVAVGELVREPRGWLLVIGTVVLSRWAFALCCREDVPAMPGSDLGHALAGRLPTALAMLCVVGIVGGCALLGWYAGESAWRGAQIGLAALVVVLWLINRSKRVFGGVNGDVMGASIELAMTTMLIGWAL